MPDAAGDDDDSLYADFSEIVARYWRCYGGIREVARSPYLHAAIVICILTSGSWLTDDWHKTAISVLPNLLGFGITGYAIWIGWGDPSLRKALSELDTRPGVTAYTEVSATFAHFALMQAIALLWAIVFAGLDYGVKGTDVLGRGLTAVSLPTDFFAHLRPIGAAIGYFFFVYAILVASEATLALFRLATWTRRDSARAEPPA